MTLQNFSSSDKKCMSQKSKPILLRDVMNSKSTNHFRHSENAYDSKRLSFYYAIESRIFNGRFDKLLNKNVRGPLWFTNIMVFDFDFDEKHFPNVEDYECKLSSSLSKLESILGKPKYKIYNKSQDSYTDWEKEIYFTKINSDGFEEVKLPKKYGCQVVYELKDSLQSQYIERVKLYNSIRLYISSIVDADENFKGHMFKNPLNHKLFNIQRNGNHDLVDIFEISETFNFKDVTLIKNLEPFEELHSKFNTKNILPAYLKNYSDMLTCFYQDLNSWKSNSTKINFKSKMFYANSCKKSESRNETLFNYFKSLPMHQLETAQYCEIANSSSNIFANCAITEMISKDEFDVTKQSVCDYRKKNHVGALNSLALDNNTNFNDSRVFKFEQNSPNMNFFSENSIALNSAANNINNGRNIRVLYLSTDIPLKLYNNGNNEEKLANIYILFGSENVLSNISSLITPDMLNFYKTQLDNAESIGMWDLYNIVRGAVYLVHFKYYRTIQEFRHSKVEKVTVTKLTVKAEKRNNLFKEWGINYNASNLDILGFKDLYQNLSNSNLLKDDGTPLAISFYQNHFHVKNSIASIFVKTIKNYLKTLNMFKGIIAEKRIFSRLFIKNFKLIGVKCIFLNKSFLNNTSEPMHYLIKSFNICYNLFIIKEIYLRYCINKYLTIKYYDSIINNRLIHINLLYCNNKLYSYF